MEDFDYSVQISDRDWDAFFQECEECDLLPPALAGMDDSGLSDADDGSSSLSHIAEERDSLEGDDPVGGAPELTGLPVERYLSKYHIPGPEDVLSCSEEDTHLESVNMFFERLKGTEGGGSFLAEATHKVTCDLAELANLPANLAQVPQESHSDSLAVGFSLTAKGDKVGGTISAGRGDGDLNRAGKSTETESEEDDVFGPAESALELYIREEDWTEDEKWENEGCLSKDTFLKAPPSCSTSSNDECGLSREHTKVELQPSRLKDTSGTKDRTREGEMTRQPFLKEDISLHSHQVELQTDPEALLTVGMAAGAENHTIKSAKQQEQHWFVSLEVGQDGSRGHFSPSVKRKRRQIWSRGDPLVAGHGFKGLGRKTKSEKQVERFEQELAWQGEVLSGHDIKACTGEAGRKPKSFSVHRMTQRSRPVPRSSELLSEVHSVKESGVDSHTAEHNHGYKESVSRLEYSKENIPTFPNQLGHGFQTHSQQMCTPANDTEIHNLSPCERHCNNSENLQSDHVMFQHYPIIPQCSGFSLPETRNGSEQFPHKMNDRFIIPEKSFENQMPLKNESTLQFHSPEDDKARCQLSNVSKISSSIESLQFQPFFSDLSSSEDSRAQNILEHEHKVAHGQNLPTFLQEEYKNVFRRPEISPSKEFIQMPNTANLPEPPEQSLALNNIGGHEPSWCNALDPVNVQCPKSEVKSPPEYQEVEECNDVPMNMSNDETTPQCLAKTDNGNIARKISCSASENEEPSTDTSGKARLFQAPELTDKQILVQTDLITTLALPEAYNAAIGLSTNSTKSFVASNGTGSSVMSTALTDDSDSDKGSQTDDWLPNKGEKGETSTVECIKKSQQASTDVAAVNEMETVLEPELQKNSLVDIPVLHTSDKKGDGSADCNHSLQQESTASAKPLETNKLEKPLETNELDKPLETNELDKPLETNELDKPLETNELDKAVETKHPVRTMSAFWKEMEKLTINDILYLRSASSAPSGHSSDAGDSGYSSHLEDSKLYRSSVDLSTISDFKEECSLSHSAVAKSSMELKDTKKQDERLVSSNSRGVLCESKSYSAGPGKDNDTNEMPMLCSGDPISPTFLSDKTQQGFRRMCKNISMQNLRALEAEPPLTQVTSASLTTAATVEEELQQSNSTFQRPEENGSSVPLESSDKSDMKTSALSGNEATVGFRSSFREILTYFFGAGDARVDPVDTAPPEVPAGDGASVPEMYDYFFSEFETGNFFFPLTQETGNEPNAPVPMTSSSHRNLQFPEAYDYFFPDSSSSDSDDKEDSDDDQAPVRVVSRFDEDTSGPPGTGAAPDMYEHFFTSSDWRESLFWSNPLSLRRMRFTAVSGSREGPTSCVVVTADPQARSVFSTFYTDSAVDFHGAVSPQSPLYCLEEQIFRDLAEKQRRYADLQTAIAVPNAPLLSLKQSDMCLICIAFASWVLKTANPQDADTWKAALLANISALSAIRYIRRYVRAGGEPGNQDVDICGSPK